MSEEKDGAVFEMTAYCPKCGKKATQHIKDSETIEELRGKTTIRLHCPPAIGGCGHEYNGPFQLRQESLASTGPLATQVDGEHYRTLKIQPIEYIHANGIPFAEGSVIKYVTRWRAKGGIRDLEKARHFLDLLIDLESKHSTNPPKEIDR